MNKHSNKQAAAFYESWKDSAKKPVMTGMRLLPIPLNLKLLLNC